MLYIIKICFIYLIIDLQFSIHISNCQMQCSRIHTPDPKFHMVGSCLQSKGTIIGYGFQNDLQSCIDYSIQRMGLAFNYNRLIKNKSKLLSDDNVNKDEVTCEVLDCPEYENFTSLEPSSKYNYFSFYTNPLRKYFFILLLFGLSFCSPSKLLLPQQVLEERGIVGTN